MATPPSIRPSCRSSRRSSCPPALQHALDSANQELGRLDGITTLLPDPQTLLYTYVRKEAVHSSQIEGTTRIVHMIERDRQRISTLGRGTASAQRVHDVAVRSVVITPRQAVARTGLTGPPVYDAIRRLQELGVLREITGRRRGKVWAYAEYLDTLTEDT